MPRSEDIYVDGCCLRNGQDGATAGVGVYFGPNDSRNVSQPLYGQQTNQRAELKAAVEAVRLGDRSSDLNIHTDSKYVVDGVNSYSNRWERNGWTNANGAPVANQDLFTQLKDSINRHPGQVNIKYVPGHSGIQGNEYADRLAKNGARKY
ncbi:Ribonuclease H1 [Entomophthora muscae]|nr:Ribonuclease H1 [Entomophthora muscae]